MSSPSRKRTGPCCAESGSRRWPSHRRRSAAHSPTRKPSVRTAGAGVRVAPTEAQLFLAWRDDAPVGIAGVFDEGDGTAQMVSVWVNPGHRGHGVGRALAEETLRFAAARGFACMRLWVTDGNTRARNCTRLGFTATGRRQPLPSNPSMDEQELELTPSTAPTSEPNITRWGDARATAGAATLAGHDGRGRRGCRRRP